MCLIISICTKPLSCNIFCATGVKEHLALGRYKHSKQDLLTCIELHQNKPLPYHCPTAVPVQRSGRAPGPEALRALRA